jgi:transcription initiation factor IIE alpha subunit
MLMRMHSAFRYDTKKVEGLSIRRTYYMIDYKRFVDVVKWKIYEMRTRVVAALRRVSGCWFAMIALTFTIGTRE